jgi:hypothetical protein
MLSCRPTLEAALVSSHLDEKPGLDHWILLYTKVRESLLRLSSVHCRYQPPKIDNNNLSMKHEMTTF